jgi:hypothetical protein
MCHATKIDGTVGLLAAAAFMHVLEKEKVHFRSSTFAKVYFGSPKL